MQSPKHPVQSAYQFWGTSQPNLQVEVLSEALGMVATRMEKHLIEHGGQPDRERALCLVKPRMGIVSIKSIGGDQHEEGTWTFV